MATLPSQGCHVKKENKYLSRGLYKFEPRLIVVFSKNLQLRYTVKSRIQAALEYKRPSDVSRIYGNEKMV